MKSTGIHNNNNNNKTAACAKNVSVGVGELASPLNIGLDSAQVRFATATAHCTAGVFLTRCTLTSLVFAFAFNI